MYCNFGSSRRSELSWVDSDVVLKGVSGERHDPVVLGACSLVDEMVEALTVSGNPLHCIRELRRRRDFGLDLPIINLPPGLNWPALAAFITAMAPRRFP